MVEEGPIVELTKSQDEELVKPTTPDNPSSSKS